MNHYYITGTSKGIGYALAESILSGNNCKVTGLSRSSSIIHPNYEHVKIDLSNSKQLIDFQFPKLTHPKKVVLINNAGSLGEMKYVGNLSNQSIIDDLHLNLMAPFVLINKFITNYHSLAAEKLIINLTSGAALKAYDGWSSYCASKAAINMLTEVVDREQSLSKYDFPFRIFAIAPGVVETGMQEKIRSVKKVDFSELDKFQKLKTEQKLYDPGAVANKLIEIINNPDQLDQIIQRIIL